MLKIAVVQLEAVLNFRGNNESKADDDNDGRGRNVMIMAIK